MPKAEASTGWSESINVAGVSIAGGVSNLPKGLYKCKTISVSKAPAKNGSGNNVLTFTTTVTAPKANAGAKLYARVTIAENMKFVMKRALLSHGVNASALEKGEVKISEKTFVGKECYLSHAPPPEGEKYSTTEFITADTYAAESKISSKHAGATATSSETLESESEEEVDESDDLL